MVFDLNIKSVLTITSILLPNMLERNKGHVVTVSSRNSKWAAPGKVTTYLINL